MADPPPEAASATPVRLTYHLPSIGNASLTLHDESAALYRYLELVGEVDRLKRLDHLGLIRVASGGAHHPRWEYVITVLNLIEHCKDAPEIHLGTRVTVSSGAEVSSGEELLRCWNLLLNLGHLAGTFSTERALMFEIWRSQALRSSYIALFSDAPSRRWVEGVMKRGRVYSFSQTLALIRLDQMAQAGSASTETLEFWKAILRRYAFTSTNRHIARLKVIFRNLRRLAFLALDSHYTPAVVGLKLSQILSDPTALAKLALYDAELDSGEDELRGLEQHLYHDVYLSKGSLQSVAVREHRLRLELRRSIRDQGLIPTIEQLARNEIQGVILTEDVSSVVRLTAWVPPPLDELLLVPLNIRVRQEAIERERAVTRAGVRPIWWAAPYGREWVLQIHASPTDLTAQAAALAMGFSEVVALNERLLEAVAGILDYDALHDFLIERFAAELIVASLNVLFDTPVRWEWTATSSGPRALLSTRRRARAHFQRVLRDPDLPPARREEIIALRKLLMRRPNAYVATAAANLIGYRPDERRQAAELDGIVVERLSTGAMAVTLSEVKYQRAGSQTAAERQLLQSLRRLRPRREISVPPVSSGRDGRAGRAWVTLVLPAIAR